MSSARDDGPLVILGAPGVSPHLIAESLRGAGEDVARRLVVLARAEGIAVLAGELADARVVFVAGDEATDPPSEVTTLETDR
jgi:hypothetical protein